jgi:hypothetical protein
LEAEAMNSGSSLPRREGDGARWPERLAGGFVEPAAVHVTTLVYSREFKPETNGFRIKRNRRKRLFRLTGPTGKVERFRDDPAKHLMLERDPATGLMQPVFKHGLPTMVFLCRPEHEQQAEKVASASRRAAVCSRTGHR